MKNQILPKAINLEGTQWDTKFAQYHGVYNSLRKPQKERKRKGLYTRNH